MQTVTSSPTLRARSVVRFSNGASEYIRLQYEGQQSTLQLSNGLFLERGSAVTRHALLCDQLALEEANQRYALLFVVPKQKQKNTTELTLCQRRGGSPDGGSYTPATSKRRSTDTSLGNYVNVIPTPSHYLACQCCCLVSVCADCRGAVFDFHRKRVGVHGTD